MYYLIASVRPVFGRMYLRHAGLERFWIGNPRDASRFYSREEVEQYGGVVCHCGRGARVVSGASGEYLCDICGGAGAYST